ncbi:MAG: TlpA family protein disulfide reductase [Chlorobiales bacterium]|jgi:peroxiredoxin|nr:TlpA family protein disulfide reductase [Chlorobiales bacterium]
MKRTYTYLIAVIGLLLGTAIVNGFIFGDAKDTAPQAAPTTTEPAAPAALSKAPDFVLQTIDGKPLRLSDYKGKAVILNFWATWCPPCRAEIPDMIELQKKYGGKKNFSFIGIAVGDELDKVQSFVRDKGINYPVAMGNESVTDAYGQFIEGGMRGIPTTFVINTKGEILGHFVGSRDKATFEEAIQQALK